MAPLPFDPGRGDNGREGAPLGPDRLADQLQARLVRKPVGLQRIDIPAAGDNILPAGPAAPLPGDDMIEGQVSRLAPLAGVLASVVVPDKDVLPVKLDFRNRKPVVAAQ